MRWLVLIISLLIILPSVYAEVNINVFGKEYPLLLIAPVILIVIFGLFFIINYLKDNISSLKGLNFLKLKKSKEPGKQEKKITRNYLAEVIKLEKDTNSISVEQSLNKFDAITKDFFSDAYSINYEFTYSELQQEMTKRKMNIDKFISKIDEVRYSGKEVTNKNVQLLIGQLRYLVRNYYEKQKLQVVKERERASLFSFISNKLHAIKLKKIHKNIRNKIERGKQTVSTDLDSSMKDYLSATLDYYKIPERKNDGLYKEIQKLHEELRKVKIHNKEVMKIAKDLTDLKHSNKQVSVESINLINKLKKAIHGIESFGKKFKSTLVKDVNKLKPEEGKAVRFIEKGVKGLGKDYKDYNEKFDNKLLEGIEKLAERNKNIKSIKESPHISYQDKKAAKFIETNAEKIKHELNIRERKASRFIEKNVKELSREYNEEFKDKLLESMKKIAKRNKNIDLLKKSAPAPVKDDTIKEKVIKITPPKLSLKAIKLKLPEEPRIYQPKAIRQLEHEKNLIYKRLQNIEQDFDKDKFN